MVETITWQAVTHAMPDEDQTVLVAISVAAMDTLQGPHEPVLKAFLCIGEWVDCETELNVTEAVTHWADMPTGPHLMKEQSAWPV